jgi:hypothetical protein
MAPSKHVARAARSRGEATGPTRMRETPGKLFTSPMRPDIGRIVEATATTKCPWGGEP